MKKILYLGISILLLLCFCSCGSIKTIEPAYHTEFTCSNLADEATKSSVASAMLAAGISEARQAVFFDHVSQINDVVGQENLMADFSVVKLSDLPQYDPYELQDMWAESYPDFFGYNCRITAYGLFGDYLRINESAEKSDQSDLFLAFDISALEADDSVLTAGGSTDAFSVLFSTVPASADVDIYEHVKTMQKSWSTRGVQFLPSEKISLITVIFHDHIGENDYELFVGHTGVLIDAENDQLWFVEKIAFQEPYQVIRVNSRVELNDYLMGKYGFSNENTAAPFIMENDHLMEGYRAIPPA